MRKPHYLLLLASLLTTPLMAPQVLAHGNDHPQYGGEVKVVGEYTFEMKQEAGKVSIWVFYDGEPLDASALDLKVKIKGENRKELVEVPAAEGNKYVGDLTFNPGDKVLAMLTLEDGISKIVAKYKL